MSAIRQSFSWWCFENRGVGAEELLPAAARIGYAGVDLVEEKFWPAVRDAGLEIVAVSAHGTITDGLNRRGNAARIEAEVRTNLEKAAAWKIPVLICFSGNRAGLGDNEGLDACADTLSRLAPEAEKAGVVLAVELLNSKVDHRDYQADHTAWGIRLCEKVGSPAVKLLYDIYHMQIMEGDLIRTIRESHHWFAHYHTAGNPGRGPLDAAQEINYPAVYRAIAATGYAGWIGHEFLPPGDPIASLRVAFEDCANTLG